MIFHPLKMDISQLKGIAKKQFHSAVRCFVYAMIPATVFYCISVALLSINGFDSIQIIRDSAQQTNTSSFLGFLSNIGNGLWVSASAISFFAVKLRHNHKAGTAPLLASIGILSMALAIDDFFMIHDRYMNQNICYAVYAFYGLSLLIVFHKSILRIHPVAFAFALGLLAASVLIDLIQTHITFPYHRVQLLEEGFKFLGAATWLYFCIQVGAYSQGEQSPRLETSA